MVCWLVLGAPAKHDPFFFFFFFLFFLFFLFFFLFVLSLCLFLFFFLFFLWASPFFHVFPFVSFFFFFSGFSLSHASLSHASRTARRMARQHAANVSRIQTARNAVARARRAADFGLSLLHNAAQPIRAVWRMHQTHSRFGTAVSLSRRRQACKICRNPRQGVRVS